MSVIRTRIFLSPGTFTFIFSICIVNRPQSLSIFSTARRLRTPRWLSYMPNREIARTRSPPKTLGDFGLLISLCVEWQVSESKEGGGGLLKIDKSIYRLIVSILTCSFYLIIGQLLYGFQLALYKSAKLVLHQLLHIFSFCRCTVKSYSDNIIQLAVAWILSNWSTTKRSRHATKNSRHWSR